MSGDSIRQEFIVELESILESDEAYRSNLQILTYSLKKEVINGKFKDSWNNRVYEFIIDDDGISYKPAAKLDSFSADEMPVRFDAYSEGYVSVFKEARLDRNPTGKRVKKPKCGSSAYGCGFSCIGVQKTCRISASGGNTGSAIGKERLNKLRGLGDKILALGDKGALIRASDIKDQIAKERNTKAGQLREERKGKVGQQQVKASTKPQEKQPTKPSTDDDDDFGAMIDDLFGLDDETPGPAKPSDDELDMLNDLFRETTPSERMREAIAEKGFKKSKGQLSQSTGTIGKSRISDPEQVNSERNFNKYAKTLRDTVAYYEQQKTDPKKDKAYQKVLDEVDRVFEGMPSKPRERDLNLDPNPSENQVIYQINVDQVASWNKKARDYHNHLKEKFSNYEPPQGYQKDRPDPPKDDPWANTYGAGKYERGTDDKNWAKTLGVSDKATKKEVVTAYRNLAKLLHPDTTQLENKEKAATEFMKIQAAYDRYTEEKGRRKDSCFNSGFMASYEEIAAHCNAVFLSRY